MLSCKVAATTVGPDTPLRSNLMIARRPRFGEPPPVSPTPQSHSSGAPPPKPMPTPPKPKTSVSVGSATIVNGAAAASEERVRRHIRRERVTKIGLIATFCMVTCFQASDGCLRRKMDRRAPPMTELFDRLARRNQFMTARLLRLIIFVPPSRTRATYNGPRIMFFHFVLSLTGLDHGVGHRCAPLTTPHPDRWVVRGTRRRGPHDGHATRARD